MTTVELMARGRKDIKETDASLARSERVLADTIAVGTATASTLAAQVPAGSPLALRACPHVLNECAGPRVSSPAVRLQAQQPQ